MIKLIKNKDNYLSAIEKEISNTSSLTDINRYYSEFIKRYLELDSLYHFTEYFDEEFVYAQLEEQYHNLNRPLFGIPFGIKDIFNTKVLPTTMGSEVWAGFKAGNNSRVVDEIVGHGGILFSKTTTAEFAVHFITPRKTLNPYNKDHITGTSSSGSAVAVSCGALPIALGTQTAGSIIRPASFCGVVGFKPSFGAIDRTGVLKTNDTLDTIGLLGADLGGIRKAFLNLLTKGKDYPFSANYFSYYKRFQQRSIKDLKIAYVANCFHNYENYTDYVKKDFAEVVQILSKSLQLSELKDVDFINRIHPLHEAMYSKSLSYYFKNEMLQHEKVSEIMTDMIKRGEKISVEEYIHATKQQPILRELFDQVFENLDFIITPATASAAPLLEQWETPDTCLIWTFLGYPTVTIPLFFNQELNLPYGLQIVAKKFDDFSMLDFAAHLENEFS